MVRVTHITYHYRPIIGGQEIYLRTLIDALSDLGVTSRVVQPRRRGLKEDDALLLVPRLPFIANLIGDWDRHLFNLSTWFFKAREIRDDALVISHYSLHTIPVRKLRERVIVLSHGIDWDDTSPTLEERLRAFIARSSFDRYTLVANDTEYLRRFGVDIAPGSHAFDEVRPGKWYIPNCVDTGVFSSGRRRSLDETKDWILVPRQITPDRGIDLAIRAFSIFLRSHGEFALVIVGKSQSARYLEQCKRLVGELGLSEKVRFLGFVERSALVDLYSQAKVCLISSVRREGTSLSALESMSIGTPTVCTYIGGLKDLPALHAAADPVDLAGKMTMVCKDWGLFSSNQQHAVQTTFDLTNWKLAWKRVLESKSGFINDSGKLP